MSDSLDDLTSQDCSYCGSLMEYREPSSAESAKSWLVGGQWLQPHWECSNCHSMSIHIYGARPIHWWAAPARVYRVFLDRRSVHPSPSTYILAAIVGAIVGIAIMLLVGWPWWYFAIGLVVANWFICTSSMFWGVHGTEPIGRELRQAVTGRWVPRETDGV